VFYPETRELFELAWKTHMRNEGEAEKIRNQVQAKPQFNAHQCFVTCDSKSDGILDKEEVRKIN
jgi:hypothetical protein